MKALVKPGPEPGLELREVPVPEPGPDEVAGAVEVRERQAVRSVAHAQDATSPHALDRRLACPQRHGVGAGLVKHHRFDRRRGGRSGGRIVFGVDVDDETAGISAAADRRRHGHRQQSSESQRPNMLFTIVSRADTRLTRQFIGESGRWLEDCARAARS